MAAAPFPRNRLLSHINDQRRPSWAVHASATMRYWGSLAREPLGKSMLLNIDPSLVSARQMLTLAAVRFIARDPRKQARSMPSRRLSCTTRRMGCVQCLTALLIELRSNLPFSFRLLPSERSSCSSCFPTTTSYDSTTWLLSTQLGAVSHLQHTRKYRH